MNTWGKNFRLSLFGQSHGEAIGIVIDGVEPGFQFDMEQVAAEMARRAPGKQAYATARKEEDAVQVVSGLLEGRSTGFPICGLIYNQNAHSADYAKTAALARPGHADYTAFVKYKGFADMRGGGHFSGRLTAPIVFAGALAKQILAKEGITVAAHIERIGGLEDCRFSWEIKREAAALQGKAFPLLQEGLLEPMQELIAHAKAEGDSIGGAVECAVLGVPAGVGEPFFASIESVLSALLFSVPGVKGVEFGDGFAMCGMHGSEANDSFCMRNCAVCTGSNHAGGINGGIANGMPIVFRAAIRPTPSIAKEQATVDLQSGEETTIRVQGRHDPCIVPRALPVIEAVAAIGILDLLWEGRK